MTAFDKPRVGEAMTDEITLDEALAGARAADRTTRIEWRNRIARHRAAAIEAVSTWVADPELGAFAVRVIEATASFDDSEAAVAALASVLRVAPTAPIRRDIETALARLRPATGRSPSYKKVHLPASAGWSWPGFRPSDFGQVVGTSWRRRADPAALVPLVLRPLLDIDSRFSTYPIYMSPEVHFANLDRYLQGGEWKQGWRASKLVIYAHGPTVERPDELPKVAAGWYIEKGTGTDEYGPVEPATWDWP